MIRFTTFAACLIAAVGVFSQAQAAPIIFTASLDGASQNPPNASLGTGFSTVTYDDPVSTLRVQIGFTGLTGTTTVAHIHCCVAAPGNAGVATPTPTFPGFPVGVVSGAYDSVLDLTLASSFNPAFIISHGGTTAGAEAALLAGLLAGEAYFNLHTNVFPGGEIRGFLTTVPEPAGLALVCIGVAGLAAARRRPVRLHSRGDA